MTPSALVFLSFAAVASTERMLVNPITGRSVPVIDTDTVQSHTSSERNRGSDTRSVTQLKRFPRESLNDSVIFKSLNNLFGGRQLPVNITVGEHNSSVISELEARLGERRIKSRTKVRTPGCDLDTREDLPIDNEPLYLTQDGLAVAPQLKYNKSVLAPFDGTLYLACIGQGNYLLTGGKNLSEARCKGDHGYEVEGRSVNLKDVTCKSSNRATVNKTSEKCGFDNSGDVYEIGFKVTNTWHKVLSACHHVREASTLYVDHMLSKLTSIGGIRQNPRGTFKEGHPSLFKELRVNNLYKKKNQKEVFRNILGRDDVFESNEKYLSRGHLAADADYIFSSHQQSTYFYINVAPQWFTVNAGNWLTLERKVKRVSYKKNADAVLRTGTHGVLRLRDSSGIPRAIYLDPNKRRIPVPAFFWKAVALGQEGIVFVVSNNPFDPPERVPCKDICSAAGWSFDRDLEQGRTFCCTFQDASRTIPDIPPLSVKFILSYV